MKDDPDMNVGSQNGTRYGISDLVLNGGLGGRLDHSVANLQILTFLAGQGARAF
jgi:thiamine pyrophosphokinase